MLTAWSRHQGLGHAVGVKKVSALIVLRAKGTKQTSSWAKTSIASREGMNMKVIAKSWGLPILLLFAASADVRTVLADDVRTNIASRGAFEAKAQYCGYCHGPSGQGYRGYYTMPRLAGQQSEYFVNQLRAFTDGRRGNTFEMKMARVHAVSQAMRLALATRFGKLNPRPFGGAPTEHVALGKKIYEEGVPEANVPACAACHAPDAKGAGANPRLAGQLYGYTVRGLINWSKDRGQDHAHPDTSAVMLPVANSMSKQQITAVAAYLSTLK